MSSGKIPPGWATADTLATEVELLLQRHPGIDIPAAAGIIVKIGAYADKVHDAIAAHGMDLPIGDSPLPPPIVNELRDEMRALLVVPFEKPTEEE